MTQYRPVRTAAKSPRMMAPLCTITFPWRTMFCEPHSTVWRLTLLPEAVSTYSSLLYAVMELQASVGGSSPWPMAANGAAPCHETPWALGSVLLSRAAGAVAGGSRGGQGCGAVVAVAGDRFFTLNLKLNDSARGVGNM
uniref:Uncharacterized protein n=1 Tax=Anopheles coluzzii TaxID=1518534 RepID=A0A8W7PET9_ANOCL